MRQRFLPPLLWLLAMLAALPLLAVQMTPLSIEYMTRRADLVVQGKVLGKTCQRDEAGRIYTRVELQVLDVWKGSVAQSPLVVVQGGGTLGEERSVVSGDAEFAIGEEVALFLVLNERKEPVTIGLAQGKFALSADPQTGARLAANLFHGASALAPSRLKSAGGTPPPPLTVEELKRRVTEARR